MEINLIASNLFSYVFVLFFLVIIGLKLPGKRVKEHEAKALLGQVVGKMILTHPSEILTIWPGLLKESPIVQPYRDLLLSELRVVKAHGNFSTERLNRIRKGLLKDAQLVRKMEREKVSSYSQFFLVFLMTWSMVAASYYLFGLTPQFSEVVIGLFVQLLGGLSAQIYLDYNLKKRTYFFHDFLKRILLFQSLSGQSLSVDEVLAAVSFGDSSSRNLKGIEKQLESSFQHLIFQWKGQGVMVNAECFILEQECQRSLEHEMEGLLREQQVIRILVICLFFAIPYFYFVLQSFLRNM